MKKGEKIISVHSNAAGQVVALTNKGRIFFQVKTLPDELNPMGKLTDEFAELKPRISI